MVAKKYGGYQSFSYLQPGRDFTEFALASDVDRLPAHDLGLTTEEEARVEDLLSTNAVVSLHDHPVRLPQDPENELLAWNR